MGDTKFYLDQPGVNKVILMKNAKVEAIEREVMMRTLDQVKAAFLQEFGFEGGFEISYEPTKLRSRFKLRATNARTGATLKANPGWLGKFTQNARL